MKVFISYSWDSEEHKEWVLELAKKLISNGIDTILDQYELSAGKDMTFFMEKSLTADKILVILTPNYKLKANNQKGGVGFEYSMIRQELFDKQDSTKFIPILRKGSKSESIPKYLTTKIYHDMSDDNIIDSKFFELLRLLLDKPKIKKPSLGDIPDLERYDSNNLLERINKFNERKELNENIKNILNSEEGLLLAKKEITNLFDEIMLKTKQYERSKFYIDKSFNVGRYIRLSSSNFSFGYEWKQKYAKSLEGCYLLIKKYEGSWFGENLQSGGENPRIIEQTILVFDININEEIIWINEENDEEKYNYSELLKYPFEFLVEREIEFQSKDLK